MRAVRVAPIVIVFVVAWLVACGDSPTEVPSPEDLTYAPELNVDFTMMTRRASGLWVQDLEAGTGETVAAGDSAYVLYQGWLPNGVRFDAATNPGSPAGVVIGVGQLIDGWDEGIPGMKVGGLRRLIIPPHLGYGSSTFGPIPGNSTLVFDVRLQSIRRNAAAGSGK
jgi:peptidylprolyl isomerase